MPETPPTDRQAEHAGPLSPAGVTALKIAIVVMGVMILAGVALAIGRIVYLTSNPSPTQTKTGVVAGKPAPEHRLALPRGAQVEQASLDGNRLLVRYRAGGETGVVVYDLVQSRVVSRVRFD